MRTTVLLLARGREHSKVGAMALLCLAWAGCGKAPSTATPATPQPELGSTSKPRLNVEGLEFRDLDADGVVSPFEDWRLPDDQRASDLLGRMTLEEKAGALLHASAPGLPPTATTPGYDLEKLRDLIGNRHITSMITRLAIAPDAFATQNNLLQQVAEAARLGIPITISTDPRHHFQYTAGASVAPSGFSQWPEMLGMAAVGDADLVRRFGDVARQEYRAVGIHMGLSPQADLATEPRWPRVLATFGEDAQLAGRMAQAYVEGFQHGNAGVGRDGVLMVIKHFAGYGAARDGLDSHNYYGRFAHFPGNHFDYHVEPFRPAFASKVGGVMPTYSILQDLQVDGQVVDQVGGGFNRWLLTDVLRQREGFEGLVVSDWAITADCDKRCREGAPAGERPSFAGLSTAWGVEDLTQAQRFARGLLAGLDQFGGADNPQPLLDALKSGEVTESRLDESVLRVLKVKFALGLFENPYVKPEVAAREVGNPALRTAGEAAQRRALVLLENRDEFLPLASAESQRVFLHGVDAGLARAAGLPVTDRLEDATLAIVRTATPFQLLHPGFAFGAIQHEGDLDFKRGDATLTLLQRANRLKVPVVVTVFLDRPAILTNVKPLVNAMFGDFGVSDQALLDVILGRARPDGRLPFELPSSMAAVRAQQPDLPRDSENPLYAFGFGLSYR